MDEREKEIKKEQEVRAKERVKDEKDPKKWRENRARNYPSWNEQLDKIAKDGIEKWKTEMLDPIKKKFPKT
tara:strand:+ start:377 stop:589 length:213 start_codon:yes stop_codon:yes gene_type:complete